MNTEDAQNILIDYTKSAGKYSKPEDVELAVDLLVNTIAELKAESERLKEKRQHTLVTVSGFLDVISSNHSVSLSNHIGGATRTALSQVICAINE